jgi:signal transduction histidine kinase
MNKILTILFALTSVALNAQTKESLNAKIDATMHFYESKKDSIKINAEQIKAEAKKLGLKQEGLYYHRFMGFYYEYDGKIDLALKSYLTFLSEAEKDNYIPEKYQAIGDILAIYFSQNQTVKCKEILKKAIREGKIDKPKPIQMSTFYNNLGLMYAKEKKIDSALIFYQNSLEIKQTLNDSASLADLKTNMASLYLEKGDTQKALSFTNESLSFHQRTNMTEDLWFDYDNMAHILAKKQKIDQALMFANNGLKLANNLKNKVKMRDSYETLAELNQLKGDFRTSLEYTKKIIAINDSIITQTNSEKIAELQEKYESEKKERINRELNNTLDSEKRTKSFYLLGFLSLLLVSGIILYAYIKNQQKNKIIAARNQELTLLNKEKNRLISMVSHDLKTPFLSIRAWYSNLKYVIKNPEENIVESIQNIGKSADQGLKLIERILDIEKESLSSNTSEIRQFDLKSLLSEVCENFEQLALNKHITIKENFSGENFEINSDPEMLLRVFENLISNAIKYSHPNSEIEVSLDKKDNQKIIKFKDQGIGIKEEEQKNLFEEYGTTSTLPTAGETSTGLGLNIAKRILDELGGSIAVTSEYGVGSTFEVRI